MNAQILTCLYFGKNKNKEPLFKIPADNIIGTIDTINIYKSKYKYNSIEIMITEKSLDGINDIDVKKELKKAKYVDIYQFINLLNIQS